jgi:hypothetical protein
MRVQLHNLSRLATTCVHVGPDGTPSQLLKIKHAPIRNIIPVHL